MMDQKDFQDGDGSFLPKDDFVHFRKRTPSGKGVLIN